MHVPLVERGVPRFGAHEMEEHGAACLEVGFDAPPRHVAPSHVVAPRERVRIRWAIDEAEERLVCATGVRIVARCIGVVDDAIVLCPTTSIARNAHDAGVVVSKPFTAPEACLDGPESACWKKIVLQWPEADHVAVEGEHVTLEVVGEGLQDEEGRPKSAGCLEDLVAQLE